METIATAVPQKALASDFFSVTTIHQAIVSFWWTDARLHDADYHIKVNDALSRKILEIEKKYDVTNDTRHCCQWEGFCLFGADRAVVNAAAKAVGQELVKFKGVVPLPDHLR